MATKKPTPAEIEQMRADVAAYDAEKAEADRLAREAYMAPLKGIATSDCYRDLYANLLATQDAYRDDANIAVHYTALLSVMPNFATAAGVSLAPVITAPVEPQDEPEA